MLTACLNGRIDTIGFIFTNKVGDSRSNHHEFVGSAHTAGLSGQQSLGKHTDKGGGKLGSNLILLFLWEHIDDTVYGTRSAIGMECTEHHMPCFSSFDSSMNGFKVAHFTDEDDIWIHTKGPTKAFFKATNIGADFPLAEGGLIMLMEILDGIFECDYMLIVIMIDEVEHGSKRGGFA